MQWIDYAKGMGIILVVYGHVLRGIDSANVGLSKGFFEISDKLVYGFHMPLFFLLSGLFIQSWAKKGSEGIIKKAKFILIPYLLWSLIQGAVNVVLSSTTNKPLTWKELLINIWVAPIGQFWYLYVLFLMFVVYYLLQKVSSLNIIIVFSLVMYVISPMLDFWILRSFASNFIFFILGAIVMNLDLKNIEKKTSSTLYLLLSTVCFVIINVVYQSMDLIAIYDNAFKLIVSLVGVNFIVSISVHLSKHGVLKFLQFAGMLSMAIFLMHILFASGLRIILGKIFNIDNVSFHIIIGTVLGVALPILAYKISEKMRLNVIFFGR